MDLALEISVECGSKFAIAREPHNVSSFESQRMGYVFFSRGKACWPNKNYKINFSLITHSKILKHSQTCPQRSYKITKSTVTSRWRLWTTATYEIIFMDRIKKKSA